MNIINEQKEGLNKQDTYQDFINKKIKMIENNGFDIDEKDIHNVLFDYQKIIVKYLLKIGKGACFANIGLGKTLIELEFARQIMLKTNCNVILLSPLAVSHQIIRMSKDLMDIKNINFIHNTSEIKDGISVTNYEKIDNIDLSNFDCIILDESSILKSYTGKIRGKLIEKCKDIKYKLCCTATPSPNDYTELGNHSEFLGILRRVEMLSNFFVHDAGETQTYRLKGHSKKAFYEWLSSWAIFLQKPSDLGFSDENHKLPNINILPIFIEYQEEDNDMLFSIPQKIGLNKCQKIRRNTIQIKVNKIKEIVGKNKDEIFLIWTGLNDESSLLKKEIKDSVEITGSNKDEYKEEKMLSFSNGEIKTLITKPKIAGFGMNWQVCHNIIFCGLDFSWESYYQAIGRCYRFGQKKEVNVYIVLTDEERNIYNVIMEKEKENIDLMNKMIEFTNEYARINLMIKREIIDNTYKPTKYIDNTSSFIKFNNENPIINYEKNKDFIVINADCVDTIKNVPDNTIGLQIYSPPFSDLYCYSDNNRDLGNNSKDDFLKHFRYLLKELYRVLQNGRNMVIHCQDFPLMKERDGDIGLYNFSGDIIKTCLEENFIYHSRITIWKDPLVEVTRTKALGLLHKQLLKDSSMVRQGIPDTLLIFRRKGENENPIKHIKLDKYYGNMSIPNELKGEKVSHWIWQQFASPVWFDIRQTNTLSGREVREEKDEKHICPLQLDTINRCLTLWSNENDIVLDPFSGIGSTGYCSILQNRKYLGIELKESYYNQSIKNLQMALDERKEINNVLF